MNQFEKLLSDKGYTRYSLAKKAGVSVTTLDRLWKGESVTGKLALSTAYKIAKALGITTDELFELGQMPAPVFTDGWNKAGDLDILVENNKIIRGIMNGKTVYPYTANKANGGYDNASGIDVSEFENIRWF